MSKKPTYEELEKKVQELEQALYEQGRFLEHVPENSIRKKPDGTVSPPIHEDGSEADITELKREKELSQLYLDAAGVMLLALNTNGDVILANRKACEVLEISKNELLGMNWFDHFLPIEVLEQVKEIFKTFLEGNIDLVAYAEHKIKTRKGKEKIIAWHNSVLEMAHGKVVGILSSGEDITARKEAESALQDTEEKLEALINAISESAFLIDREGKMLAANDTGAARLGFATKDLIGLPVEAYTPPEILGHRMEMIQQVASTGEAARFSTERGGRMFESTVWPIANAEGYIDRMAVVAVDVTERRKMKEDLKTKEFAMESAISAIAIADSHFRLTYVNGAFLRLWGFADKNEALGRSAFEFWEEPAEAENIAAALEREEGWFGELTAIRNDGKRFFVQISANAVVDQDKRIIAFMGSFVDITASKAVEKDLREKTRRLEEVNTALKVLIEHRDAARQQLAENVMAGVNTLIRPYLRRIREEGLNPAQETLAGVIETHLHELMEPLPMRLSAQYSGITPREIEIAGMIREGKTSDEISESLHISRSAVVFHRQNLRDKLGLKRKKKGLRARLQEIIP